MGPFMAVIEKTDVLDVRSFCEMHCIFARISVFSYNRKNPLQTGANSAMIPFVNRGACASRLRVGCIAQTRKPDLDNANVGRYRR